MQWTNSRGTFKAYRGKDGVRVVPDKEAEFSDHYALIELYEQVRHDPEVAESGPSGETSTYGERMARLERRLETEKNYRLKWQESAGRRLQNIESHLFSSNTAPGSFDP